MAFTFLSQAQLQLLNPRFPNFNFTLPMSDAAKIWMFCLGFPPYLRAMSRDLTLKTLNLFPYVFVFTHPISFYYVAKATVIAMPNHRNR